MEPTFKVGERVTANGGFPGVIVRHYYERMWEVRLPGGLACICESDIEKLNVTSKAKGAAQ